MMSFSDLFDGKKYSIVKDAHGGCDILEGDRTLGPVLRFCSDIGWIEVAGREFLLWPRSRIEVFEFLRIAGIQEVKEKGGRRPPAKKFFGSGQKIRIHKCFSWRGISKKLRESAEKAKRTLPGSKIGRLERRGHRIVLYREGEEGVYHLLAIQEWNGSTPVWSFGASEEDILDLDGEIMS